MRISDAVIGCQESAISFFRQISWRYPEWWVLLFSALAWSLLITLNGSWINSALCTTSSGITHLFAGFDWVHWLLHWSSMVAAMMFPLVVPQVRHISFRSLWRRRQLAVAEFVVGYFITWVLCGCLGLFLILTLEINLMEQNRVMLFFVLAALWQLTRYKRLAMSASHRTVTLPPSGWLADLSCLRSGLQSGYYCVASCGILMFAANFTHYHFIAMIAVALILFAERYYQKLDSRVIAITILSIGIFC